MNATREKRHAPTRLTRIVLQELRKEIQTLTSTVGKLAEGSKQQSWAQVGRGLRSLQRSCQPGEHVRCS